MMSLDTQPTAISEARNRILSEISSDDCLVAASKRQPDTRIDAALAAGQRVFGENRVQEAALRWTDRKLSWPDLQLRLIGPLQTNKAEEAVRLFDIIETLDREKLLKALIKAIEKTGCQPPDVLIQVNTGDEPQKGGVRIGDLDALLALSRQSYPGRVAGLMCIPPASEPAAPHFALLKRLADRNDLSVVSMGMSNDYALAARRGATHVRVGTALFGARDS
ncbi:MAG: YggS family pyridoxal phosphate-dependent enzyme [Pseudomonadota bacterium]